METAQVAAKEFNPNDLTQIQRKAKYTGTVVKTTLAGAIVNIGLDMPGVLHISQLQAESINRVEDVVKVGQTVDVWIKRVDAKKNRIDLTMIEPLMLEWREIATGLVVKGKVSKLEKFGAFVEIGAERPGLVHISEMTHGYIKSPSDVVQEGDEVEVQVLEVNRRKKQIKLSMKALDEKPVKVVKPREPEEEKVKDKDKDKDKEIEVVPTAMEMALRQAMERSSSKETTARPKSKRKSPTGSSEIEEILSRTLKHKVRTGR